MPDTNTITLFKGEEHLQRNRGDYEGKRELVVWHCVNTQAEVKVRAESGQVPPCCRGKLHRDTGACGTVKGCSQPVQTEQPGEDV